MKKQWESKIICGRLHYRAPCVVCKQLIWQQLKNKRLTACCDDCMGLKPLSTIHNEHPTTPKSEQRYNG